MKFLARVFCVMLLSFSCAYGGRLGVASFNVRCKAYGGLTCLAKQVKAVTQLMKKYASGIDFWCLQELFSTEVNPLESLQQTGYRFVRDTKNSSSEFAIAYNSDNWELLDSRTVSSHTPHALNRSFQYAVFRSLCSTFPGMIIGIINCHMKGGFLLPVTKIPPMSYNEKHGQFKIENGVEMSCDKKVAKYLDLPIIQGVYKHFASNGFVGQDLIQRSLYHSFRIHQLLPMVKIFNKMMAPDGYYNTSQLDACIIGGDFNWHIPSLRDQNFLLSCLGMQAWSRMLHPKKKFDQHCIDFMLYLSRKSATCCKYLTVPENHTDLLGMTEPYGLNRTSHCSDHPLVMAEIEIDPRKQNF